MTVLTTKLQLRSVPKTMKNCGAVLLAALLGAGPALAAPTTTAAGLSLELNKLETVDKGCRAYMVINNASETGWQALKLDLVLFQPDGVIGKRIALDLAPVRAAKRSVKLFDFDGLTCDKIGSILVNDATECRTDAGPIDDCLPGIAVSSLASVKLSK